MKKHTIAMLAIVLIYALFYFNYGELIPQNDGFGWDGMSYKIMTQNPPYEEIFTSRSSTYTIQRIFIPITLNVIFKLFNIPLSDSNILISYRILNLLGILICILFYNLIANELRLKNLVRWLGFCSLFINYAILKQSFYYPVLLDTTIFTIGLIQFYCYLKNNLTGLVITTVLGSFTWPSFLYPSLMLMLFPLNTKTIKINKKNKAKIFVLIFVCILYVFLTYYTYTKRAGLFIYGENEINKNLFWLSIICSLLYLFFALNSLLDYNDLYKFRSYINHMRVRNVLTSILVFIGIYGLITLGQHTGYGNIKIFIMKAFLTSSSQPFISVLSHIIYYGPILMLTIYYWRSISNVIHSYGIGLTLYSIFYILVGLYYESRGLSNAIPVFVILTLVVLNKLNIKLSHFIMFCTLSVIYSKVWFKFGIDKFGSSLNGGYQQFPNQNYFMNFGPWMSWDMYLLQGSITLIFGMLLFYILNKYYKINEVSVMNEPESL